MARAGFVVMLVFVALFFAANLSVGGRQAPLGRTVIMAVP